MSSLFLGYYHDIHHPVSQSLFRHVHLAGFVAVQHEPHLTTKTYEMGGHLGPDLITSEWDKSHSHFFLNSSGYFLNRAFVQKGFILPARRRSNTNNHQQGIGKRKSRENVQHPKSLVDETIPQCDGVQMKALVPSLRWQKSEEAV